MSVKDIQNAHILADELVLVFQNILDIRQHALYCHLAGDIESVYKILN